MKGKAFIAGLILTTAIFVSCGNSSEPEQDTSDNAQIEQSNENEDAVTSPSKAFDANSLEIALKDSWIVLLESDVTTDKDVVLESGFTKNNEPASRVLGLFKTDENKNVVASYTLTTPKLIIKDENAKIEGGTLKGDIYIEANGVKLEGTKVEGNVYFTNQEYKDSFHMDEDSSITGVQEVK